MRNVIISSICKHMLIILKDKRINKYLYVMYTIFNYDKMLCVLF